MISVNGIAVCETLAEIVDPRRACLVVWDVQAGLVGRIFNQDEFLSSLKGLISGLRTRIPIVYTLITPPPREFRSAWNIYAMMRRWGVTDAGKLPNFMAPGSKEREIPEVVKPVEGDVLLEKPVASIFVGTNFEPLMRSRGIETLIFSGIATELGIESSARDASNRGFYPVVVSDCVSSMDREAHERSLKTLEKVVIVKRSTEVLEAVAR